MIMHLTHAVSLSRATQHHYDKLLWFLLWRARASKSIFQMIIPFCTVILFSFHNYSLFMISVPRSPTCVTAISKTSTSISVQWSGFSASDNITGFVIFYREIGKSSWQKSPASNKDTEHDLLMLKEYTLYTTRVFAFTKNGMGTASSFVDCLTKEGGKLLLSLGTTWLLSTHTLFYCALITNASSDPTQWRSVSSKI